MNQDELDITPYLKVETIEKETHKLYLKEGLNTIGRKSAESESNIQIPTGDARMSRRHFYISVTGNEAKEISFLLYDADSTNGTILKGFKEEPLSTFDKIYLKNLDVVIAGKTKIVLVIPEKLRCVPAFRNYGKSDQKTVILGKK